MRHGLWRLLAAGLALCLVVVFPSSPAGAAIPQVIEASSGGEGGIPINGEVISAKSSDPSLLTVDAINTGSFRGINYKCAAGKTGVAGVTVTWKDATGKEQTTFLVVTCGIKISQNLELSGQGGSLVRVDLPAWPLGRTPTHTQLSGEESKNEPASVYYPAAGQLTAFGAFYFGKEGTYTFLIRVEVAGQPDSYVLVTFNIGPRKVTQLLVPENRMQGVVLAPGQCPGNLAFTPGLSGVKTAAQYAGAGFETQAASLTTVGIRSIVETECRRRDAPTGWWRLSTTAARVEFAPTTGDGMWRALTAVNDLLKAKTRSAREFPVDGLGDQGVGMTANFTLSTGEQNQLIFYVARLGNVVYWVAGQGQVGSLPATLPEATIFPYAQRLKTNIESQAQR